MFGENVKLKVRQLLKQEMVYSSFYSAIATLIKIGTAFFLSKIVAVYVGPKGLGLIGQLTNFVTVTLVFAGGGFTNGIVKYIAQYKQFAQTKLGQLISTCFTVSVYSGLVIGAILFATSFFLSGLILGSDQYGSVFRVFGATVVFYSLNNFFLSLANGYKDYKRYNFINSLGSVIGLALSFLLMRIWGINGALLATVTNQSVIFFINYFFVIRKAEWFDLQFLRLKISTTEIRALSRYLLMAVVAAVCAPIAQMCVRWQISRDFSLSHAGIWEAVNRISNLYLMFITISLTTYYLPKLSETAEPRALKQEIVKVYKFIMPLVIICSASIYLCRHLIIRILFTDEFGEAESLFAFQNLGDVLKISSWLLAFLLVAKGKHKLYIFSEVFFNLTFVLLSILCLRYGGFRYVSLAYTINYLLYGIYMFLVVKFFILKAPLAGQS
jgi:PST family polysaccharide transporter